MVLSTTAETATGRGRNKNIEASLSNSPYLSSPIRPKQSATKSRPKQTDSIAPLRDVTVLKTTSPSSTTGWRRHNSCPRTRMLPSDDCCSLADTTVATVCTTRTSFRPSPYASGIGNGNRGGLRGGKGAKPPRLLLLPNEIDDMILKFKQKQHESKASNKRDADGNEDSEDGEDDEEQYVFSDEESTVASDYCQGFNDATVKSRIREKLLLKDESEIVLRTL